MESNKRMEMGCEEWLRMEMEEELGHPGSTCVSGEFQGMRIG